LRHPAPLVHRGCPRDARARRVRRGRARGARRPPGPIRGVGGEPGSEAVLMTRQGPPGFIPIPYRSSYPEGNKIADEAAEVVHNAREARRALALTPSGERPVAAHVLNVNEHFGPTIQGEGPSAGQLCTFLRLAGCHVKCSWCDIPQS